MDGPARHVVGLAARSDFWQASRCRRLGTAAAIGLVVYFICAVTAHLRVRDRQIGGAVFFLLLAVAALTTSVGYHNHW